MRAPGGRAAATIVAVAATLAGCTSSGSSEPGKESAVAASRDTTDVSPVEEALGLLSRDVGLIDFRSDRHSAERLGLLDDEATSHAELGATYADRAAEVPRTDLAAVSQLAREVDLMTEGGAAFSQVDVRWSMRASTGDPLDDDFASVEVFRLVDGIDMDDVVADLEDAGFERSEQAGWVGLHLDGTLSENVDVLDGSSIAGRYPRPFFPDVSVHPETHLVAFGDVGVLDPSGSSGVGETVAAVVPGDLGDLEVLAITPAAHVTCYEPVVKTTNYRASPNRVAAWARTYDVEELGVPGATLLAWVPGREVVHRSFFSDAQTAQQALVARRRLYAQARRDEEPLGVLMPDGSNESPYEPGWTMTRTDRVIEVRHNRTDPVAAVDTYLLHGLGFDTCGAPGMFS